MKKTLIILAILIALAGCSDSKKAEALKLAENLCADRGGVMRVTVTVNDWNDSIVVDCTGMEPKSNR